MPHRMKRGFYTIMTAQFFSSLADNALFVVAVELLRSSHAPELAWLFRRRFRSEWGVQVIYAIPHSTEGS